MARPLNARQKLFWVVFTGTSLGAVSLILLITTLWDRIFLETARPFHEIFLSPNLDTVRYVLPAIAQCLASTLGITFTVVAVIVQLTADRYSPKIVDMFVRDRITRTILSLFVISIVYCLWLTQSLQPWFIPARGVTLALFLMSLCFGVLLPYFYYVFELLKPTSLIQNIKKSAFALMVESKTVSDQELKFTKEDVAQKIEELSDIAMTSTEKLDTEVSLQAVEALKEVVIVYLQMRNGLPVCWFEKPAGQNLYGMVSVEGVLSKERLWVEVKALRQMTFIFGSAINRLKDVTSAVAVGTRHLGEAALRIEDKDLQEVVVKYFNSYLRLSINRRDASAIYNVLYQYRMFGETLIQKQSQSIFAIASYFYYYGQQAENLGMIFILDTAAHDLMNFCVTAHENKSEMHDTLLADFLSIYKMPLEKNQNALRGILKNYLALATFYRVAQAEKPLQEVVAVLKRTPLSLLKSMKYEIQAVREQEFWEVTDRVINFDYLKPAQRQFLDEILKRVEEH